MSESVEKVVENYVRTRFRVREDDEHFDCDVNLWENGYVDSAGVVEMIAFLEKTFGVRLPEEALFDPDFTNVHGISRILKSQMNISSTHGTIFDSSELSKEGDSSSRKLNKSQERAARQREAFAHRNTVGRK